jgi:hypothetical protein
MADIAWFVIVIVVAGAAYEIGYWSGVDAG